MEFHIIGQIVEASQFIETSLFCKWSLQFGSNWRLLEGIIEGQTITDSNKALDKSIFAYPLDIHLSSRGIQGWPKLHLEVWTKNALNQCWPIGFGVIYIPSTPGHHELVVNTWKISSDSFFNNIRDKFHGGGFAVNKNDLIYSGGERYKLSTTSAGILKVELMIIFKNFKTFGVEY